MTDFLQLFFSGLATGSIYALAALGFTLLWQASGTINFAQGEFVMLPAFMMLAFISLGAPMLVSFVLTVLLAVLVLGWVFKRGVVDPLLQVRHDAHRRGDHRAVDRPAQRRARRLQRRSPSFPQPVCRQAVQHRRRHHHLADVGTFALALVIVLATQAFLAKTVTGRAMQAVAQNTESATVLGINVPRMIFYTFAINAVLAWRRRCWSRPPTSPSSTWARALGTKAFFAAIIGGFNNSRGALLGGLIVGVCENLASAYISPAYKDAVALVIFMVVILFKPQGLLGKKEERKV
jgi:branched-chain amino acid transport system permease protein